MASFGVIEAFAGYFSAFCRSEVLGDFHYVFDPSELEQAVLGQFVPLDVDDTEERRVRKAIRRAKRKGRFARLRFEELGDWDTWVSVPLRGSNGQPLPGSRGFEPQRYTIDVSLDPRKEKLEGGSAGMI